MDKFSRFIKKLRDELHQARAASYQRLQRRLELLNDSQWVGLSFILVILIGTILFMLPFTSTTGKGLSFIDALFTATSATCVTGLAVVTTGEHFNLLGQIILLLLIQIGGLGLMTITAAISLGAKNKLSLKTKQLLQEALNQSNLYSGRHLMYRVIRYTLYCELGIGTILAVAFYDQYGLKGIYYGYWHAVSAFCNAGFDLFGDSLMSYQTVGVINGLFMALIILGGLGFTVIHDLRHSFSWRYSGLSWSRFSLHTKIVLVTNSILLAAGTLVFWALEASNEGTLGSLGFGEQLLVSLFHSVSSRTAGFNSVDLALLTNGTLFFMVFLMLVGASPASTGGGLKTTTMALLFLESIAHIRGKNTVVCFGRRIDQQLLNKATSIFVLAMLWLVLALFLLLVFDNGHHDFKLVVFELCSAFGTVGLGIGITGEWNLPCKLVLIASMFVGRIGILTFGLSFFNRKADLVGYPSENIVIG